MYKKSQKILFPNGESIQIPLEIGTEQQIKINVKITKQPIKYYQQKLKP